MSPQTKASMIAGNVNVESLFGKAPLLAIVDDSISSMALRVLVLMAVQARHGDAVSLSYEEIGSALSCSARQVKRCISELEKSGYVAVGRKHNCRNSYEVKGQSVAGAQGRKAARSKSLRCSECKRTVKGIGAAGLCRKCVADAETEVRIRGALLVLGADATPEAIYQHLHVEKGAAAIRRVLRRMEKAA